MRGKPNPQSAEDRLRLRAERMLGGPGASWSLYHHSHTWRPPTDVHETDTSFTVVVEIAGMQQGEFRISYDQNLLSIAGVRPNHAPRGICHQMEIYNGEFRSDIYIATAIDADAIQAQYADGFLVVTIPKARARRVLVVSVEQEPATPQEPAPPERDTDASNLK